MQAGTGRDRSRPPEHASAHLLLCLLTVRGFYRGALLQEF